MIQGFVSNDWEPVIEVKLIGKSGESKKLEAVVDTGFNGHLSLTESIIDELKLPWLSIGSVVLADGTTALYDSHEGHVEWQGELRRIPIDLADSIPLIGMRLLEGNELVIRAVIGGDVKIRTLNHPIS